MSWRRSPISRLGRWVAHVGNRPHWWGVGALLWGLAGLGCTGTECEDKRDCPNGQDCSPEGTCFAPTFIPPPVTRSDAGPPPDVGPRDAQVFVPIDGGPPVDGGVNDGGPPMDGGVVANPDAGVTIIPGSRGLIWVGELRFTTGAEFDSRFVTYGELVDETNLTIDAMGSTMVPDNEGGTCEVKVRRTQGMAQGYDANTILVGASPTAGFGLEPVGNGRFEFSGMPPERMFSESQQVTFNVRSTGQMRSVDSFFAVVSAPRFVTEMSPLVGAVVALVPAPNLTWVPVMGTPLMPVPPPFTVELYDSNREVVLTCQTPDDGAYQMVDAAITAWFAAGPVAPYYLEMRRDREAIYNATVNGGPEGFPITFRASWGVRFQAQ